MTVGNIYSITIVSSAGKLLSIHVPEIFFNNLYYIHMEQGLSISTFIEPDVCNIESIVYMTPRVLSLSRSNLCVWVCAPNCRL